MKKFALIFALSLGMISCSDKSSSSSDTTSEKQLSTIEDYTEATLALLEETVDVIESTTPANSDKKGEELLAIVTKGEKIEKEAEEKFGKAQWDAVGKSSKVRERMLPAVLRVMTWSEQNAAAFKNGEFAPSFMQAMEKMQSL